MGLAQRALCSRGHRVGETPLVVLGLNPALEITCFLPQPTPGVTSARRQNIEPGGKGTNVARILAALGLRVSLIMPLDGPLAAGFAESLRPNIEIVRVPGGPPMRASVVLVTDNSPEPTIVRVAGEATPTFGTRALDALRHTIGVGTLFIISGSLPDGLSTDYYAECVAHAKELGARTVIDVPPPALTPCLASGPEFVIPNEYEAMASTGTHSAADAARALVARGARTAIVTRGAQGIVVGHTDGVTTYATKPVDELNGAGAGDAFTAGFVHAIADGASFERALNVGASLGAAAVTMPGSGILPDVCPVPDDMLTAGHQ